jgi:hypothetical protein
LPVYIAAVTMNQLAYPTASTDRGTVMLAGGCIITALTIVMVRSLVTVSCLCVDHLPA